MVMYIIIACDGCLNCRGETGDEVVHAHICTLIISTAHVATHVSVVIVADVAVAIINISNNI